MAASYIRNQLLRKNYSKISSGESSSSSSSESDVVANPHTVFSRPSTSFTDGQGKGKGRN